VTLPSSFIALRREAVTTMISSPFLFCSYIFSLSFSHFVLFSFNRILTKNLKIVVLGPVLASAFSSYSRTPFTTISLQNFFHIFNLFLSFSLSLFLSLFLSLSLSFSLFHIKKHPLTLLERRMYGHLILYCCIAHRSAASFGTRDVVCAV
jgi:hypothetical protein